MASRPYYTCRQEFATKLESLSGMGYGNRNLYIGENHRAEICKIFFGETIGGPAFVKAGRASCSGID